MILLTSFLKDKVNCSVDSWFIRSGGVGGRLVGGRGVGGRWVRWGFGGVGGRGVRWRFGDILRINKWKNTK